MSTGVSFFAHALGESRASAGEDRHVGAQAQAQGGDAVLVPAELPEMVQGQERRGGVGAAAADAAPWASACPARCRRLAGCRRLPAAARAR